MGAELEPRNRAVSFSAEKHTEVVGETALLRWAIILNEPKLNSVEFGQKAKKQKCAGIWRKERFLFSKHMLLQFTLPFFFFFFLSCASFHLKIALKNFLSGMQLAKSRENQKKPPHNTKKKERKKSVFKSNEH